MAMVNDGDEVYSVGELLLVQYKFGRVCINGDTRRYIDGIVVAVAQHTQQHRSVYYYAREGRYSSIHSMQYSTSSHAKQRRAEKCMYLFVWPHLWWDGTARSHGLWKYNIVLYGVLSHTVSCPQAIRV